MLLEITSDLTTQEKLLYSTANHLQLFGYHGSGLSTILKEAGVPKGSMYHHFPKGKDELVCEAIRLAGKLYLRDYAQAMKAHSQVEQGLNAIIDLLKNRLLISDYTRGCPISTVSLEVANHKELIRAVCWEVYTRWEASFSTYLEMQNIPESEEKAKLILDMIEGAFILSKAHKSVEHLEILKKAIPKILH